jgi:hypothetical protein
LNAGEPGSRALKRLHRRAKGPKFGSVTSATARGEDAIEQATRAALAASNGSACPASTARELVFVAFHNRPLEARTRELIESCARGWNPSADLTVVEEARPGMKKRARVVAFARRRQPINKPWVPPRHLMPLVQAGWAIGARASDAPELDYAISREAARYTVRLESELVLDLENAEEIVRSTPMHQGEVALLVKAVADSRAQERLLSAGIFCATVDEPEMLDKYGDVPGAAIQSALTTLDRSQICDRVRRYVGDYVLTGLWSLSGDWLFVGEGVYAQWRAGTYQRAPVLEQLQLHRVANDGTYYFRGIIRLESTTKEVPRLRYRFGVALDDSGLRPTRLEPVDAEYDVKAEMKARVEALREKHVGRQTQLHAAIDTGAAQQLSLPNLVRSGDRLPKSRPRRR